MNYTLLLSQIPKKIDVFVMNLSRISWIAVRTKEMVECAETRMDISIPLNSSLNTSGFFRFLLLSARNIGRHRAAREFRISFRHQHFMDRPCVKFIIVSSVWNRSGERQVHYFHARFTACLLLALSAQALQQGCQLRAQLQFHNFWNHKWFFQFFKIINDFFNSNSFLKS